MNIKLLITFLLIVTIGNIGYTQSSGDFKHDIAKLVPPSPDAASLGKYGDVPVSLNTGTPNINIPLYSHKGQDLSLSISLDYNASGFKVSEVSSWVGLGWTLNTGGVITRYVHGLPDESTQGYFNTYNYYKQNIAGTKCDDNDQSSVPCFWRIQADCGVIDLEPDDYFFNFDGYSGKIIFNENQEAVLFPYQDLKVQAPQTNSGFWVITTPDGTIYTFDEKEVTTFRYGGAYTSTWYLKTIQNANRTETINFTYAENDPSAVNSWNEEPPAEYNFPNYGDLPPFIDPCVSPCSYAIISCENQLISEIEAVKPKHLKSISFSPYKLTVNLSSDNQRADTRFSASAVRLTGMQITAAEQTIASYTFNNNSYFVGDDNVSSESYHKRLKLNSVHDNLKNSDYSFEYFTDYQLPAYWSASIDHWGYFNNAYNSSLIPPLPSYRKEGYPDRSFFSANRETDPDATKACMLTKIKYPTGGYTSFTWESHLQNLENEAVNIKKGVSGSCSYGNVNMTLSETNLAKQLAFGDVDNTDMPVNVRIDTFTLDGSRTLLATLRASGASVGCRKAYLYKGMPKFMGIDFYNNYWLNTSAPLTNNSYYNLEAGKYCLVIIVSKNSDLSLFADLSYDYPVIIPFRTRPVGGVRIKQMKNSDGINTSNDITTDYVYRLNYLKPLPPDAPSEYERSSLTLFTNASSNDYEYIDPKNNHLIRTSYLVDPMGYPVRTEGSHIGYDEVTEIYSGKQNGLKITTFVNSGLAQERSQPLKEEYYDSNLKKVKSVTYKYATFLQAKSVYYKKIKLIKALASCTPYENNYEFCFFDLEFYDPQPSSRSSYLRKPQSITTTSYFNNSLVKDSIAYEYGGAAGASHFFPTKVTTFTSDEKPVVKEMYYPTDYIGVTSGWLQSLKTRNMKSTVIESIVKKDGKITDAGYTEYSDLYNILTPRNYYKVDMSKPLESFSPSIPSNQKSSLYSPDYTTLYGADGNVIQYQKTNDGYSSLFWSYNNAYPVIKAENVDYSTLSAAVSSIQGSFQTFLTNSVVNLTTDAQKSAWRSFNTALRSNSSLSKALITTYTYTPLVGMTSQTDPNGVTTYYEYDSAGRLKCIKDDDGRILKTYEYHYKQ
jgi:YD repeat-containing protein